MTPDGAAGAFGSSEAGVASPVGEGSYDAAAMEGVGDEEEEDGEWGEARDEETGQVRSWDELLMGLIWRMCRSN